MGDKLLGQGVLTRPLCVLEGRDGCSPTTYWAIFGGAPRLWDGAQGARPLGPWVSPQSEITTEWSGLERRSPQEAQAHLVVCEGFQEEVRFGRSLGDNQGVARGG